MSHPFQYFDKLFKYEHHFPLQCSCLENSMDRGAWRATVCEVAKSWTWPSTCAQGRRRPANRDCPAVFLPRLSPWDTEKHRVGSALSFCKCRFHHWSPMAFFFFPQLSSWSKASLPCLSSWASFSHQATYPSPLLAKHFVNYLWWIPASPTSKVASPRNLLLSGWQTCALPPTLTASFRRHFYGGGSTCIQLVLCSPWAFSSAQPGPSFETIASS